MAGQFGRRPRAGGKTFAKPGFHGGNRPHGEHAGRSEGRSFGSGNSGGKSGGYGGSREGNSSYGSGRSGGYGGRPAGSGEGNRSYGNRSGGYGGNREAGRSGYGSNREGGRSYGGGRSGGYGDRREGGYRGGGRDRGFSREGGSRPFQRYGGGGRDSRSSYASGDRGSGGPSDRRAGFVERAKRGVMEAYTGKGATLVQALRAIDDLDSAKSLMFERLDEMWHIHFPEFKLENEESYCRIISKFGSREKLDAGELIEIVGEAKAADVFETAQRSFGSPFTWDDSHAAQELANAVLALTLARKNLEKFVDDEAKRILPNVTYLSDSLTAARLLSVAGGLEKLGKMPASTIQVIGAENALFKHLRSGSPPPKHGVIFQCAIIRGAPLEKRGKIARSLAAKLAIAARADAYTKEFIAPKLKETLEKRLKSIAK